MYVRRQIVVIKSVWMNLHGVCQSSIINFEKAFFLKKIIVRYHFEFQYITL
jgi:hypothetical protein